jgi:anthranilate synthase/aminodeoxychorismate synthase-like glutamine amidotransferase
MILLLDNYDSFTWNVYQAMAKLGVEVVVKRNDALTVDEAIAMQPSAVVLSPGPGKPSDAGIQPELLRRLPLTTPLLGVCLGHQGLVECHGGTLERDPIPTHGKSSLVHHDGDELFEDLPNPFQAGRYHSLRAKRDALPAELKLTAWTSDGLVMAVRHVKHPRFGVQFHPESILTPQGERVFARFLSLAGEPLATR